MCYKIANLKFSLGSTISLEIRSNSEIFVSLYFFLRIFRKFEVLWENVQGQEMFPVKFPTRKTSYKLP